MMGKGTNPKVSVIIPIYKKAGQRMMSGILGHEVPFEICYNFRLRRFETANDAVQVVSAIHSLYDAFMVKQSLSIPEKRAIRRDAAQRLISLAWRWLHVARMRREFLSLSFRLNPLLVAKIIMVRAVHRAWRVIARLSQWRAGYERLTARIHGRSTEAK